MTVVRPTAVAGTFYPAEPDVLERQLARLLTEAGNVASPALPKAIIGPHAGYAYSGAVAATAFGAWARRAVAPRRIVIVGPAHRVAFMNRWGLARPKITGAT